jgi:RNA polymerase sigma-70 factor, ECF subfamily
MLPAQPADDSLARVASGDAAAFEALYDKHSPLVYALLMRMLRNAEDAHEVLQETFIQVWNRASSFDPARGSETAWLVSIARSRGLDRIRSSKLRSRKEDAAGKEISIRKPFVEQSATANRAEESQMRLHVRGALAELPEPQRLALEMAYYEGLSQSEIAERLKEPLGTIKTRMQLGMKKLRESLKAVW